MANAVRIDQNVLLYGLDSSGVPTALLVDSTGAPSGSNLPIVNLRGVATTVTSDNNTHALNFTAGYSERWTALSGTFSRITFPYNGIVRYTGYDVDWGDNAAVADTGRRSTGVLYNGSGITIRLNDNHKGYGGSGNTKSVGPPLARVDYVTANDYVEIVAVQGSGGDLSVAFVNVFIEYVRVVNLGSVLANGVF